MRRARLHVAVVDGSGRTIARPGLAAWLSRVAPAAARGQVTVALIGHARMRALNREYRGKDYPTDVLSFSYTDPLTVRPNGRACTKPLVVGPSFSSGVRALGDIVIATGVARRQARQAGRTELAELRVLALHGLLHLLGYDHETDDGTMARVERRLRRKGGIRE